VTGAVALIWSEFPDAGAAAIKLAVISPAALLGGARRNSLMPPLLDAWSSYQALAIRSVSKVVI
jgi:hypothetical protein